MSQKSQYFQAGVFLLVGIILFLAAIITLGAGKFLKKKIYMETYFNESVQGLDIGSFVKFRGVQIGKVQDIKIVSEEYPFDFDSGRFQKYGQYVMVKIELESNAFSRLSEQVDLEQLIASLVNNGLRVQMNYLGITGLTYLEINYVDPQSSPPLEIDWEPKCYYIPSIPSPFVRIEQAINDFSQNFDEDFFPLMKNLNNASEEFVSILKNINISSLDFPEATSNFNESFKKFNDILEDERENIKEVLDNLHYVSENLKDISVELKQNPSGFIFREPPKKTGVDR